MKAILVIDVDDIPTKELVVSYRVFRRQGNKELMHGCKSFKPLPQSKQMENRWFSDDYSQGWNDCLKEIEDGSVFL